MTDTIAALVDRSTRTATATAVDAVIPRETWPFWFPGWAGDVEAALLDAVFSSRATYGGPTTGVRRVIAAWRRSRCGAVDDLRALTTLDADVVDNRQRVPGNHSTKADAARAVAAALLAVGVTRATDVDGSETQHDAFVSVAGVGELSWECFLGALGVASPLSDAGVDDFLRVTLAVTVDGVEDRNAVLDAVAGDLDTDRATLRHAVWRYQRSLVRRPRTREVPAEVV
ncbi:MULTISPECIES: hypothetical protein [unclassified Rhodococcus (in: high G+C Gram-positive bacteria)]|uniref:hypothetical protein n=1 Tax=unclassified Rhodococcus (in: high G+C Gram-positive bacteria) TaxID=192944 RepID=UPI0006F42546|nr:MULTISPECIES: hypothetical protein [unclassified Rhodococcus (in: high G+C Gram-positive bacteria)]KQU29382.1 hypothetical protein ASG69_06800 [Rhodococcus sp. Leaf225]KQU41156.1 hypothetical protein ASH03_19555 [Rhodococcus sp. Leaf258]